MAFLGSLISKDDLPTLHQDDDDTYFDRINEKYETSKRYKNMDESFLDSLSLNAVKQEPISPSSECAGSATNEDYTERQTVTGNIVTEQIPTISRETTVKQELFTPPARKLTHQSAMRKSMSSSNLLTLQKSLQQLDLDFNETPLPHNSSVVRKNGQAIAPQTRFVSMAEQIYHLQRDTPKRFHTTFKQGQKMMDVAANRKKNQHLHPTVPQSPALMCKNRSRPITVMSQHEIEEREIEEMRKYKIKANPIPRSVTSTATGIARDIPRKASTVAAPFNLTEMKKKEPQSEEEKFVFTAKPAPKHILEKPQLLKKTPVTVTLPISPNLHKARARSEECLQKRPSSAQLARHGHMYEKKTLGYKYNSVGRAQLGEVEIGHTQVPLSMRKPIRPGKPVPFSFEKRDEETKQKKEERIKQVFEEEKKMREFKANPIPGIVKKKFTFSRNCSHDKIKVDKENQSDNIPKVKFEAKPPIVLKKDPFVPVLDTAHVIEPCPFNLSTMKRACERENFNKHLKEKEEECLRRQAQAEEERRAAEEREVARLRSQLVHHAQPVRHYAPVQIKPSLLQVTVPESPHFSKKSGDKH